jgi:hypothetical protein
MSLERALRFLEDGRKQPDLQRELGLMAGDADHDALCALGARYDYDFTPAELARAFAINWLARWAHFARESGNQDV